MTNRTNPKAPMRIDRTTRPLEAPPSKPHSPEWEAIVIRYRPHDLELRNIRNEREGEYYADVAAYGDLPTSKSTGVLRDVLRVYQGSAGLVANQMWTDQNLFRIGNNLRAEGVSNSIVESFIAQTRRIARNKNARPLDRPVYSTKKKVKDPYVRAQYEAWWLLVAAQPNPSVALQLAVTLCAALGAGAAPNDLRLLRWEDIVIEHTADGVRVDVWLNGANETRGVPVCEPWATRLAETIGDRPDIEPNAWVVGTASRPKNMLSTLCRLIRWGGQDRFIVSRLRTTWIAERLSVPVRIDVLLEMCGRSTLSTIIQIADLLTDEPNSDHFDQLRTPFPDQV